MIIYLITFHPLVSNSLIVELRCSYMRGEQFQIGDWDSWGIIERGEGSSIAGSLCYCVFLVFLRCHIASGGIPEGWDF